MKRTLIITLALALALGTAAMAETVPTEAAAVASTEEVVQEQATAGETDDSEASVTFEDALKALRDARQEARQDELKAELDGYVAAGKLTQEQADVILKQFSDKTDQKQGQKHNRRGDRQRGHGWQQNGKQGGNQMPQQDDQRMPQGGQLPQQGGQQIPDANSSATPQMPGNGQQEQQPRMGGQQMPGNHRQSIHFAPVGNSTQPGIFIFTRLFFHSIINNSKGGGYPSPQIEIYHNDEDN